MAVPNTISSIPTFHRHCASERVVFGDVTYKPAGVCGPRIQADFQLVLLEQGEATVDVDGEALYVPPQHVALMLPGRREHFRFTRDGITHHSWCAVRPDAVAGALGQRLANAPRCQAITPRIRSLVEFGLSLPPSGAPSAEGLIEHIGLAALHEYVFEAESAYHEQTQPEALRAARDFVDQHLADSLELTDIARAAYVTPQYLIRLFRQHLGVTPARYVWQLRVARGVELLRETGLPIAEIAHRTGFKNPFHFSRMVKQLYHASPRQLRKQAWGTPDVE
jgi:AraC-like DNA-binding protein